MVAKRTVVSKAVSSVVTPAVVTPAAPVVPEVTPVPAAPVAEVKAAVMPDLEVTKALGKRAVAADGNRSAILNDLVVLLKDQPFPVWEAVRMGFEMGATEDGYSAPARLWSRYATEPLALLGINKPQSEKSSAAREVKPEVAAKQAAAKAEREAIAKMSVEEMQDELETDDIKPERRIAVLTAKLNREKEEAKAAEKARKDDLKDRRTACFDIIKSCDDKMLLDKMHMALAAVIAAPKAKAKK